MVQLHITWHSRSEVGDLASAKPYYQYVVDNYAGTEKARTSKNYLAQEQ